jgi:tRNA A37 threonylcarbamoyladenosine biosynthesis protein TsaE
LEEYVTPDGVTVIEWAERWFGNERIANAQVRWVKIETLSETERRITYEDIGA